MASSEAASKPIPAAVNSDRVAGYEPGRATQPTCECERTDHPQFPDGRCHREGDGAEAMTGGRVTASPALCLPCLFCCTEDERE